MEKQLDPILEFIKKEALLELKRKLLAGTIGHISATLIIVSCTPLLKDHLGIGLLLSGLIIVSSLMRIPFARQSEMSVLADKQKWKIKVHVLLYVTLFSWAALFFFTSAKYPFSSISGTVIALIAAGHTSNSAYALSSDAKLARIFTASFMSPIILSLIWVGESDSYIVSFLCLVHLLYNQMQIGIFQTSFRESKEREFRFKFLQDEQEQNSILLWGILNALEDAVVLKDTRGRIQMLNKTAEDFMNIKAPDAIGRTISELIANSARDVVDKIDERTLESGETIREEIELDLGGASRTLARTSLPYRNSKGHLIGLLSVSRDITATKKQERALRLARDELEDRFQQRTRDLSVVSQSLVASQERLDSILSNAPLALWLIDTSGRIVHVDGSGFKKLAIGSMDFTGSMFVNFFTNREAMALHLERVLAGEDLVSEGLLNGVWFEFHWSQMRDSEGSITGTACLGIDISERKRSEQAVLHSIRLSELINMQQQISMCEHNVEKIVEIVCTQAVKMTSSDGTVVEIVDGDALLYKWASGPASASIGLRIPLANSLSGMALKSRQSLICNDTEDDPRVNRNATRKLGIRSMLVAPMQNGNRTIGVLKVYASHANAFTIQQMQSLQLMGELLAAAMIQSLEFEEKKQIIVNLQVTEKRLTDARAQAEAGAQAKADFLASMSHEIRTPLNGIIGMTELLLDTPLTEQQLRFARIVQNSGSGLLAIINDILDFSKIDAGKMEIEETTFDTVLLVESQADLLTVKANEKNLSLMTFIDPRIPDHLDGDAGRISQILLNLLSNAIKFTQVGSVTVQAKLVEMNEHDAIIKWEVVDTGIGIPPETQIRLFNPFTQADGSTARRYGGTGLGLSISKRLIDLMGGHIGIKSEEGKGACFWFTLKLKRSQKTAEQKNRVDLSPSRILIVDDDAFSCEVIFSYLHEAHNSPALADNGVDALNLLQEQTRSGKPFDLVIIDKRMSNMDGFELAHNIQADPLIGPCKLILITAFDEPGQEKEATAANFSAFLTKPLKRKELWKTLTSLQNSDIEAQASLLQAKDDRQRLAMENNHYRILVVEDNPVNQLLAVQQLGKMGLKTHVAGNGIEALEILEQQSFDLILMDCQMPNMDGFETTQRIREIEKGGSKRIPIVAMTANAMSEDEQRCRAAGMDDFLTKPVRFERLESKLRQWLPEIRKVS